MRIRHMPARQRPRERLLRDGVAALGDAELLALFLRTGIRGCDALALAGQLLDTHQGLAGLMSLAPYERVRSGLLPLRAAARELGCTLAEPFLQVAFLPLPVIPHLKITDLGLFDVDRFALVVE